MQNLEGLYKDNYKEIMSLWFYQNYFHVITTDLTKTESYSVWICPNRSVKIDISLDLSK